MLKILGTMTALLLLNSCSTMRSIALGTASPMFMDAMGGIEAEGNWESFRQSTPGNLALIDGLLATRPDDEYLLAAAIKGNAGFGFGVHETLYLNDKLADNDKTFHKDQAIAFYAKAFDYGQAFLSTNDLEFSDLKKYMKDKRGIPGILDSKLSDNKVSLEAILFTAQALGSMINLQRENIQLVSYLPVVKGMFDWVCQIDPDIAHGTCQIFYGSYEAGRPAMLGGNPEKGKKIFEDMIEKSPHNWLARVAFIEHFAIPQYDEKVYNRQKKDLIGFEKVLERSLNWDPKGEVRPALQNKRLRLYQAIAIKRFKIIRQYEKEIF